MADHVREQITAACVSALTGLPTTGARVWRARERALQPSECPALVVIGAGESVDIATMGSAPALARSMRLRVTAHVRAGTAWDSTLAKIAAECEAALVGSLGGAKLVRIAEIEDPEVSEEADKPIARQTMIFEALYYTAHGAPTVAL